MNINGKQKKLKSSTLKNQKLQDSVKNVDKKKHKDFKIKNDFMDLLSDDVWDYMNSYDERDLK